jgi:hypothetical protein
MGKARDWGDVGAEGGPGAIRREGDDPATDIPVDGAPPQPNGKELPAHGVPRRRKKQSVVPSEDALALDFAGRHGDELRFVSF